MSCGFGKGGKGVHEHFGLVVSVAFSLCIRLPRPEEVPRRRPPLEVPRPIRQKVPVTVAGSVP